MKKGTFTPAQIAGILKEFDGGKSVEEITRQHGVSRAAVYKWRQRYGGMEASELKRIKELEEENAKLKKMYANLALELDTAKYLLEKSCKALPEKQLITELQTERPKDISKACRLLHVSRSSLHYQSVKDDITLEQQLQGLSVSHPVEGFWKCYHRLRNSGEVINHKRLHRIYKQFGLPMRRKVKKRLPARVKEPLAQQKHFTHTWSIDFMSDALSNGVKFRSFHVIDDYNREVLFIETDYSLKSSRVVWVLRHLVGRYGKPQKIRMDNGPEFVAKLAGQWSEANGIEFKYIEPGKPMQNAYIERFNKTYREGILDAYLFEDLEEVREVTAVWLQDYNNIRPHDALGGLSPRNYQRQNGSGVQGCSATATPPPPLHTPAHQNESTQIKQTVYF